MATALKTKAKPKPQAEKAYVFAWEGRDRRGAKVTGETARPVLRWSGPTSGGKA